MKHEIKSLLIWVGLGIGYSLVLHSLGMSDYSTGFLAAIATSITHDYLLKND